VTGRWIMFRIVIVALLICRNTRKLWNSSWFPEYSKGIYSHEWYFEQLCSSTGCPFPHARIYGKLILSLFSPDERKVIILSKVVTMYNIQNVTQNNCYSLSPTTAFICVEDIVERRKYWTKYTERDNCDGGLWASRITENSGRICGP
jgi:hypothetical protein